MNSDICQLQYLVLMCSIGKIMRLLKMKVIILVKFMFLLNSSVVSGMLFIELMKVMKAVIGLIIICFSKFRKLYCVIFGLLLMNRLWKKLFGINVVIMFVMVKLMVMFFYIIFYFIIYCLVILAQFLEEWILVFQDLFVLLFFFCCLLRCFWVFLISFFGLMSWMMSQLMVMSSMLFMYLLIINCQLRKIEMIMFSLIIRLVEVSRNVIVVEKFVFFWNNDLVVVSVEKLYELLIKLKKVFSSIFLEWVLFIVCCMCFFVIRICIRLLRKQLRMKAYSVIQKNLVLVQVVLFQLVRKFCIIWCFD